MPRPKKNHKSVGISFKFCATWYSTQSLRALKHDVEHVKAKAVDAWSKDYVTRLEGGIKMFNSQRRCVYGGKVKGGSEQQSFKYHVESRVWKIDILHLLLWHVPREINFGFTFQRCINMLFTYNWTVAFIFVVVPLLYRFLMHLQPMRRFPLGLCHLRIPPEALWLKMEEAKKDNEEGTPSSPCCLKIYNLMSLAI